MTKDIATAFNTFISWTTPSAAERSAVSSHREEVYNKLNSSFDIYRMFESGSFKHGTGVSQYSDVDYFVSLKSSRPAFADSALVNVKKALQERFKSTYIHVSRPAVVIEFAGGDERVEVIPAYPKTKLSDDSMKFSIPGVVDEWLESTPEAHLKYVNQCNSKAGVAGGAKSLARLAKAWKYYRNVPISSFYLEMRAAAYMSSESSIVFSIDLKKFLNSLKDHQLASMNDPTGNTGRIAACSSDTTRRDALSKLETACNRADWARYYESEGRISEAFEKWDMLFDGHFPSYY